MLSKTEVRERLARAGYLERPGRRTSYSEEFEKLGAYLDVRFGAREGRIRPAVQCLLVVNPVYGPDGLLVRGHRASTLRALREVGGLLRGLPIRDQVHCIFGLNGDIRMPARGKAKNMLTVFSDGA